MCSVRVRKPEFDMLSTSRTEGRPLSFYGTVQEMEGVVLALYPEWSLVQSQSYDFGEYRTFLVPSFFGKDILE